MAPRASAAFAIRESDLSGTFAGVRSFADLAAWLKDELEFALATRGDIAETIRYYWTYYEQGRTRAALPWADAADLTSPYATEFVDAIHGRLMDGIMVEPLWIVEGWGESQSRAAFVEEFHQRTQEQERLQTTIREVTLRSLLEPAGILEISEGVDLRRVRKTMRAVLELDATGQPLLGEDGQPVLARDPEGQPIEAPQPTVPSAEIVVDVTEPVRMGPVYDVVPYLDYVRFPQHARTKAEIWGYGKRFWRRVPELQARAAQGLYDARAVEALGEQDERVMSAPAGTEPVRGIVVDQRGPTAQKELWEIPFLADLDGHGERWWLATLSREHTTLLRLQVDDRLTRFIEFVPFPRPGSRDGYPLVEKMITLLEEDTALRNMIADRAALATSAPLMRTVGGLWNPYEQPFAPGAVIDVRDQQEVRQLQVADVPQSVIVQKQGVRSDLERGVGLNDVSVGQETQERRTLGEVRLAAGYSEVRVKAILTTMQESLEELGQARHEIWKKTLASRPEGIPITAAMQQAMDARGITAPGVADGRVTAEMLEGQFWFKPRGSVETASLDAQARYFHMFLNALAPLLQILPALRVVMNTPQVTRSLLGHIVRLARIPDKQAFLGAESQAALDSHFQQQQLAQHPLMQAIQQMAAPGGAASTPAALGPPGGGPSPGPSPSPGGSV